MRSSDTQTLNYPHPHFICPLYIPVLESDAEPGCKKFVQLGAWENAYFATSSKLRQNSAVREARARVWSYVLCGVIAYDRETEHRTSLGVHQVWYGEVTMRYPAACVDAA